MLQDFQILQKRVTKVLPILIPPEPAEDENIPTSSNVNVLFDWTDNDSEELFDKVAAIDPIFCAKITGMLLEKKPSFLRQCLTDNNLLNSAVEKARTTYLKSLEITSVSSLLETANNEAVVEDGPKVLMNKARVGTSDNHLNELGNSIFSQVVMWYPKLADKITGMLLEMNIEELESVVNDSALLKNRADKAFLALKNSGYLTADYQVKEKISLSYR